MPVAMQSPKYINASAGKRHTLSILFFCCRLKLWLWLWLWFWFWFWFWFWQNTGCKKHSPLRAKNNSQLECYFPNLSCDFAHPLPYVLPHALPASGLRKGFHVFKYYKFAPVCHFGRFFCFYCLVVAVRRGTCPFAADELLRRT